MTTLSTCNKEEFISILSEINELTEELVFMLKNPNLYNENTIYEYLEMFRKTCFIFSQDTRGTGTLMKDLEI